MQMVLDDFINYIKHEKRYSVHTVSSYRKDLEIFKEYLKAVYECEMIKEATHPMIRSWIIAALEEGISVSSVKRRISTLKSFFKYAQSREDISSNPMLKVVTPKKEKLLPNYVKEKEMNLLLSEEMFSADFIGLRDMLIIELLYQTGVRVSELVELKLKNINLSQSEIRVLGKRSKERIIPISEKLSNEISVYLEQKRVLFEALDEFLLATDKGKKVNRKFVYDKVKYYLSKVSSLKKKSPHVLRHTFATHMLKHGADLNAIKELLGHASLAATQVYAHNSLEQLKLAHKNAHPRENKI